MATPLTNLMVRQDGTRKTKVIANDYIVGISAFPAMGCVIFRVNNGVSIWIPKSMLDEAVSKYAELEALKEV